jgi:hypothetical protein
MEKTYHQNGQMLFKLERGQIHGFVLSQSETAWIHRPVGEFDLIGSVQISEADYLAQIKKFVNKIQVITNKWQS